MGWHRAGANHLAVGARGLIQRSQRSRAARHRRCPPLAQRPTAGSHRTPLADGSSTSWATIRRNVAERRVRLGRHRGRGRRQEILLRYSHGAGMLGLRVEKKKRKRTGRARSLSKPGEGTLPEDGFQRQAKTEPLLSEQMLHEIGAEATRPGPFALLDCSEGVEGRPQRDHEHSGGRGSCR